MPEGFVETGWLFFPPPILAVKKVRTKEALAMRKEHGMPLGRKPGDSPKMLVLKAMKSELLRQRASGVTISQLSTIYGVSRGTMGRFLSDKKK